MYTLRNLMKYCFISVLSLSLSLEKIRGPTQVALLAPPPSHTSYGNPKRYYAFIMVDHIYRYRYTKQQGFRGILLERRNHLC